MPNKRPTLRESTETVDEFCRISLMLIEAAGLYAEAGVYDPENDGMVRRLKVNASALQSALINVSLVPPSAFMTTPTPTLRMQPAAIPPTTPEQLAEVQAMRVQPSPPQPRGRHHRVDS